MKPSTYSSNYEKLRLWMKEKRKEKGLTIREVGVKLNRDHTMVTKMENKRRRIEITEFVKYCQAIDADPIEGITIFIKSMEPTK